MAANDHADLIRRKLRGPSPQATSFAAMRPELDAMRAAARAAYSSAGLKAEMRASSAEEIVDLTALLGALDGAMLIVPFRASDHVEGYVALSHEFAQSLIEKATTGSVSALPVEPRRASSIDMLLCREFLARFMEAWQELSEGKPTESWIAGFRPADQPVDTDLLTLHARDVPFRLFRVELKVEDARDAQLLTAFPTERHPRNEVEVTAPQGTEIDWGRIWRDTVMDTHAALDATLVQMSIPLKDVKQWRPGDLVDVPSDALSKVSLGRQGGAVVATARLGQARGHRALRLNTLSKEVTGASLPEEATAPPVPSEDAAPEFDAQLPVSSSDATISSGPALSSAGAVDGAHGAPASENATTGDELSKAAPTQAASHDVLP